MIKETMEFLSQYDPEVGATIEKEYHREPVSYTHL